MTINLSVPTTDHELKPRITVIGVGGAGGNAVNNMINSNLGGVDFITANTDAQAIAQSMSERTIQLGANITHGLGAGSRPDIGRAAAEEALDEIAEQLRAAHMVFITAGMGGGTGTGAAPVIARLAREQGILTVGVVTKPFQFEGIQRMRTAEAGIEEMQQYVDTLIIIPNQNLFRIANEKTTFADAFSMADEVLHSGVRGVTDLMVVPGLINLDFADIRSVMTEMGKAMMGTGEGEGDKRATEAAEAAISNPLLDEVSMRGARGVLINITGGPDMTLFEVDEAANRIGEEVDSDANIIFGSTMDPSFEGKMRVSVVATGIDAEAAAQPRPVLKVYSQTPKSEDVEGDTDSPEPASAPAVAEAPVPTAAPVSPPAPASAPTPSPAASAPATAAAATMQASAQPAPEATREPTPEPVPDSAPEIVTRAAARLEAAEEKPAEIARPAIAEAPAPDAPVQPEFPETAELAKDDDPVEDVALPNPAAPPAAQKDEDAFIPPAPVDPKNPRADTQPDPYKQAGAVSAGDAKPSRPSLFQRITGVARGESTADRTVERMKSETVKQATETRTEPPAAAKPTPAPKPKIVETDETSQSRLKGVDPDDRLPASQSEEDLLDIPAFLRRQAN